MLFCRVFSRSHSCVSLHSNDTWLVLVRGLPEEVWDAEDGDSVKVIFKQASKKDVS